MKVKFYGVRGSYPVPSRFDFSTQEFGGNTTCVSITKEVNGKIVRCIIDCGTGAINLGKDILSNYFDKKEDLNLNMFFTHLHPDHTQAFPFFAPNYFKDCKMNLLGMKTLKKHIGHILEQEMLPPTFPIEYKDLKNEKNHYVLSDGMQLFIDEQGTIYESNKLNKNAVFMVDVIQAYAPSHPQQGAMYYRFTDIENGVVGKSVTCVWDIESHTGGDMRVIEFAKETDLLIHDTQYTEDEYFDSKLVVQGYGHSTYRMAIKNFQKSNAKQLACIHYNPSHNDDKLNEIKTKMEDTYLNIVMAKEGYEIEL